MIYQLGGIRVIEVAERRGREWRFLTISHQISSSDAMRPVIHTLLRNLDFFAAPMLTESERKRRISRGEDPASRGLPDWFRTMRGNGSGSIVSRQGHILTNHHVIEGCARLTVNGEPAVVLGSDVRLDLALLRSDSVSERAPIRFRADNPRLGEAVSVMGYPLFSMSRSINYTRGYVSSVVGHKGDRTRVQITAPVQPGNSGGPVVDSSGRQVAVVVAKLSAEFQIRTNAENVAWVIRGKQALDFLEQNGIAPIIERSAPSLGTPSAEEVALWRQVTVRIECHGP